MHVGVGETKVSELHFAGSAEQQVVRAYIAVNDRERIAGVVDGRVRVFERAGQLQGDVESGRHGHRRLPRVRLLEEVFERRAVDQLHDHDVRTANIPCVEHAHDVVVPKRHPEPRLVLEHRPVERLRDKLGKHALDRDGVSTAVLEDRIAPPYLGHSPGGDPLRWLVARGGPPHLRCEADAIHRP